MLFGSMSRFTIAGKNLLLVIAFLLVHFIFVSFVRFKMVGTRSNGLRKEWKSKPFTLDISTSCLSGGFDQDLNLQLGCKYLSSAIKTTFYLPDQLEVKNIEKLRFTAIPASCRNVKLLVLLNSGNANNEKRNAIRETWKPELEKFGNIKVFFVTAESMDNTISQNIREESSKYQDMIIVQSLDEYSRISIKHVMMYRWMRDYCESADFLLKGDDDIIVDPSVYLSMEDQYMKNQTLTITAWKVTKASPFRDSNSATFSRWNIPSDFYPFARFPDYASGPCFIVSKSATMKMLETVPDLPAFGIDDTFVTGIAAALSGVKVVHDSRFRIWKEKAKKKNIKKEAFCWLAGSAKDIMNDWQKVMDKSSSRSGNSTLISGVISPKAIK